ncbi:MULTISPECIES: acyl-CoA thioesterase domain-containing protein [Nocardia]|uniref:acyl-CoA thioesterase domain-containing protein n=2 Tax=Nocardiaceae TaxID=85025 RepID=UPI000BF087F6|nr:MULTISPECIES: acyl-CoA thioesterase domain-containing protein [Nocardia]MBF6186469.1 thioesterase family protein [Nocardia farcinica]MBF6313837.1 thioesterase family protein [Nocardia farcinica]MBF6409271.1 thioesterase family protein [Nocardia farcinica]PEH74806.1 hypothetical protein CRM89_01380 [Nocardia sp. FDAARGOS_372]PFW99171.1 hypothetical protein CJ469_05593 [Nocardia farcinica]
MVGFFTRRGEVFHPEPVAVSWWRPDHLGGVAVCGLLGRGLEALCPTGFVPARFTADLFAPVFDAPIELRADVIRAGSRIVVAEVWIVQDGHERVRASGVFLRRGEQPPGRVWTRDLDLPVPPPGCVPVDGGPPLFRSGSAAWTGDFAANQNADRKASWHSMPPVVIGEQATPFQRAALTADAANQVCHWGTHGAGYINADVTLALSRLPAGFELGLYAENTFADAGISIGTAIVYDRVGPLGTCTVTTLSNAHRQVDLAAVARDRIPNRP